MMPCIACLRGRYTVGTQIQISCEPILIALIVIISTKFWSTTADAEQSRTVARNRCNSEQVIRRITFPSSVEFHNGIYHLS